MKDTTGAVRRCFSVVVVSSFFFFFYTGVYSHCIHPLGGLESLITKCHQSKVCNKVSNERVKNHYWVIYSFNIIALADINKHIVAVQLVSRNATRRISCSSASSNITSETFS